MYRTNMISMGHKTVLLAMKFILIPFGQSVALVTLLTYLITYDVINEVAVSQCKLKKTHLSICKWVARNYIFGEQIRRDVSLLFLSLAQSSRKKSTAGIETKNKCNRLWCVKSNAKYTINTFATLTNKPKSNCDSKRTSSCRLINIQ